MLVEIEINGSLVSAEVDERTLLLEFVRDVAGLTGARNGCLEARCGCCAVLLDGDVVKSCNVLAVQAAGRRVETVEGLAGGETTTTIKDPTTEGSVGAYVPLRAHGVDEADLHPLQQAFHEIGALQCGYCTAGMLITLREFLERQREPTEVEIRQALRGNLCRCTGYQSIVDAALLAAARMRGEGEPSASPGEKPSRAIG